ncbi:hypothetical protein MMC34_007608 [Xylographa carneopallida]|nr:hypothetical protein [Xylographa carneopallida]
MIQTSALECTQREAEVKDVAQDEMTVQMAGSIDRPNERSEVGVNQICPTEVSTPAEDGNHKAHVQIIDNTVSILDHKGNTAEGQRRIEEPSEPPEDEGYVSAEDNLGLSQRGPEHLSVRQPQLPVQQIVRSTIFEPRDSLEQDEIAGPPLLARLTASTLLLPLPTIPLCDSDGDRRPSSFPSLQTFDDIPGLRRQSFSRAETMRLVTISAEATSRAHHHWLRPCAACARKAGAESQGWHLLPKAKTGDKRKEDGSVEGGSEASVYKRTAHWVKRQEERIKHL